jgi:transposase
MAIPMPIVQDIRRLDRQGMSRAQIARRLHVDRGTVAKYADMEDCSPKPKADRRYGSKIDPYAHLVDGWLEADRMLPRKQRHTIRRVHDRLLAETDYDGEYSTTMRYVHRWREANRGVPDREGYVRLEWAAGSMQVDFGVARARIAGEMADVHCLVVSLPYSNMRLCVALPGENAECLCHGLMLVFEHIGGVPPVIVMDNATGAGRRNAKGEVALTGVFSAFVAHYRLEVRFCNPYSGNEKGSVENAVGFLRRNLMVPPMRAESYGQLSRLLLECISSSRCFVFSHVFFSGLGSCMHFPYFSGCAEVFLPNMRASLTRRLWPVNSRSRPWCTMRSMIAAASLSSAKTVPHLLNSMFVVNMMLRLS